jgi:hypothetical protein
LKNLTESPTGTLAIRPLCTSWPGGNQLPSYSSYPLSGARLSYTYQFYWGCLSCFLVAVF